MVNLILNIFLHVVFALILKTKFGVMDWQPYTLLFIVLLVRIVDRTTFRIYYDKKN